MKKKLFKLFKTLTLFFSFGFELMRFYPIRKCYIFIKNYLRDPNEPIQINGNKMLLDRNDSLNISIKGTYEDEETELVKKEIKKGETVLDIGANIGFYTLLFAKLVGEDGRVFAFEPEPENFSILKKNISLNKYNNITIEQKAVSDSTGEATLCLNKDNVGGHYIYLEAMRAQQCKDFIKIKTIALDDYFSKIREPINFIKMDIEGVEAKALRGMIKILQSNKSIRIISEFSPTAMKKIRENGRDFLLTLINLGFEILEIKEGKRRLEKVNIDEILPRLESRGTHTNLFCARKK